MSRKFKGRRSKDNKGYLDTNKKNYTPTKTIEGGNITMDGVKFPVIAMPMDEEGNPMGVKFMKPGDNYEFEGAHKTLEVPSFRKGEWRKNKFKTGGENEEEENNKNPMGIGFGNQNPFALNIDGNQQPANEINPALGNVEDFISNQPDNNGQAINYGFSKGSPQDFIGSMGTNSNGNAGNTNQASTTQGGEAVNPAVRGNVRGVVDGTGLNSVGKTDSYANDMYDQTLESSAAAGVNQAENDEELQARAKKGEAGIEGEEQDNFFNPYAGVDIPTAAYLFGENIGKGGDPTMAVASGAKLALGLGRNVTSGMAYAKRNAEGLKEARDKKRAARVGNTRYTAQEGGQIDNQERFNSDEVAKINDSTGISFTEEGANQLFMKDEPFVKPPMQDKIDLGMYKDVGYFDVSMNGSKFVVRPSSKNYKNAREFKQDLRYLEKLNPNVEFEGVESLKYFVPNENRRVAEGKKELARETEGVAQLEEGGELDPQEVTGNMKSGEEEGADVNVELEVNEYYKVPGAAPVKVLGNTHERGGEGMNLEEGTQIISDHLKFNKKQAKEISEKYDIKVSTKDTYAKALDIFNKKSGLSDLIKEETEIIETIKSEKIKAQEKGMDEGTSNINLEFLSSKINEIAQAKTPLEELSSVVFDSVFQVQEASKEKSTPTDKMKKGGTQGEGTSVAMAKIQQLVDKYNIPREEAEAYLKELQEIGGGDAALKDVNPGQGLNEDKLYGSITAEEFKRFKTQNEFWFDFTNFDPTKKEDVLRLQKEYNSRTDGNKVKEDGKFGEQTRSMFLGPGLKAKGIEEAKITTGLDNRANVGPSNEDPSNEDPIKGEAATTQGGDNSTNEAEGEGRNSSGAYLLPDQSLLPPQGLIMPTKVNRRYGELEAKLMSPDRQLEELNRQVDAAMGQLDNLPSGQREAAIVKLTSNAQNQANNIISTTERANNEITQKVDALNLRQRDRTEDANATDILSYEQRVQGAQANTEDDFRRFFNESQSRNVKNFDMVNSLNLLNSNYENVNYTNEGVTSTNTSGWTPEQMQSMLKAAIGFNPGETKEEATANEKAKATANEKAKATPNTKGRAKSTSEKNDSFTDYTSYQTYGYYDKDGNYPSILDEPEMAEATAAYKRDDIKEYNRLRNIMLNRVGVISNGKISPNYTKR